MFFNVWRFVHSWSNFHLNSSGFDVFFGYIEYIQNTNSHPLRYLKYSEIKLEKLLNSSPTCRQSPQNVGSWDPGCHGRFCKVKKVCPKIMLFDASLRSVRIKVLQLLLYKLVIILSYIEVCLQQFLIAFYFHIRAIFGSYCVFI